MEAGIPKEAIVLGFRPPELRMHTGFAVGSFWEGVRKMISPADRRVALEFKRRLDEITTVLNMRVFGSRARGDAAPDADLDVFVEVDSLTPALRRRIDEIAWEVGFERDYIISSVVVTRAELQHGPLGASPLILNIEREGVPL